MNFTGKLEGLKMDYATKKQSISVEVNEDARDAFQELKDCEKLDIQIKKHREKRSLDANAYYWVLITKFAKKLELSNPEAHNMCLIRYGYPVILSGKSAFTTIPDTEEAENKVKNSTEYHLQPTSQVREIKISGHANYAVSGSDIVCAGVTALAQTLIKSIKDLTDDKIEYEISPGRVDIKYGNLSEKSKTLVDSFFIGICMIAEEFPEYVRIM